MGCIVTRTERLLRELAGFVAEKEDPWTLFHGERELLGLHIGWARPDVAEYLLRQQYPTKIDPEECEIVMLHATGITECHLHKHGSGTFFVLGPEQHVPAPSGGVLLADFVEGQKAYHIRPERHRAGDFFEIPAKKIHAFFADPGSHFVVLGFVMPRIQHDDQFDVVRFGYVPQDFERVEVRLVD